MHIFNRSDQLCQNGDQGMSSKNKTSPLFRNRGTDLHFEGKKMQMKIE